MGVHLLVLPFKMGIYRKRNVHGIGSSLPGEGGIMAINWCVLPRRWRARGYNGDKMMHFAPLPAGAGV